MLKQYVVKIGEVVIGRIMITNPVFSIVFNGWKDDYIYWGDGEVGIENAYQHIINQLPTQMHKDLCIKIRMDIGYQ